MPISLSTDQLLRLAAAWIGCAAFCWLDWHLLGALIWREARWPLMAAVFCLWCELSDQASAGAKRKLNAFAVSSFIAPAVLASWALSLATDAIYGSSVLLIAFSGPALDAVLLSILGATIPCVLLRADWKPTLEMLLLGAAVSVPSLAIALLNRLIVRNEWAYLFGGMNVMIHVTAWAIAAGIAVGIRNQIISDR